jgi:tetratricopeptide (TPR) repeat protein
MITEFDLCDPVWKILTAIDNESTGEFRNLVEAAQLDPKIDFRHASLAGLPLEGADISGFDLSGSDLRGTCVRKAKKFDGVVISHDTKLDPADKEWWSSWKEREWERLMRQAETLIVRGQVLGETALLAEAVTICKMALSLVTRTSNSIAWAINQNSLGDALCSLGERESGTARLEEAVAAFRDALKIRTRERAPLNWATTQTNLGAALYRLGERESVTARLEEAVLAFREVLKERTRERAPLDWAKTQNDLGTALLRLGERERHSAA